MFQNKKKLKLLIFSTGIILLLTLFTSILILYRGHDNIIESVNTDTKYSFNLEKLPELSAKHCIVTEYESGRILYEKNAFRKTAMASTTKIMTALIVIEKCNLNEFTTVSQKAAAIGGSEINLKTGEKISVEHLLYGLMLESGNDAAIALAEHTAGNVEKFCELMNQKALQLGAQDTKFTSPHGLDNEDHYTTAYDLARITKSALQDETFKKIVATKNYTAGKRHFVNTNALLGTVDGVDGGKTGFTNNAGRCIVLTAKRNGMRIIVVILGCPDNLNRTIDGKRIIECIYTNYRIYDILPKSYKIGTLDIKKSKTPPSDIITAVSVKLPLTQEEYNSLVLTAEIEGKAHVIDTDINSESALTIYADKNSKANSVLGKLKINCRNRTLIETDIIQTSDVTKKTYSDYLVDTLKKFVYVLNNK